MAVAVTGLRDIRAELVLSVICDVTDRYRDTAEEVMPVLGRLEVVSGSRVGAFRACPSASEFVRRY